MSYAASVSSPGGGRSRFGISPIVDRPANRLRAMVRRVRAIQVETCRVANETTPISMIQPYGPTKLLRRPFDCRTARREATR
jgi:hypothetical protein